jgi:hypothetical protein
MGNLLKQCLPHCCKANIWNGKPIPITVNAVDYHKQFPIQIPDIILIILMVSNRNCCYPKFFCVFEMRGILGL